jgi:hypothetical protein
MHCWCFISLSFLLELTWLMAEVEKSVSVQLNWKVEKEFIRGGGGYSLSKDGRMCVPNFMDKGCFLATQCIQLRSAISKIGPLFCDQKVSTISPKSMISIVPHSSAHMANRAGNPVKTVRTRCCSRFLHVCAKPLYKLSGTGSFIWTWAVVG